MTLFRGFSDDKLCPAVSSNLRWNPLTSWNSNLQPFTENVETILQLILISFFRVRGCFLTVAERLNEEFYKVLKSCDAHSNEYVDRLKDEEKVMAVLLKAQKILEKTETPSEMCRIYLQRIDHIYFKFDSSVIKQKNVSIYKTIIS